MSGGCSLNTDPPEVRCGMCGGRCRTSMGWSPQWIECRGDCCWSSCSPRRVGFWWALRVLTGVPMRGQRAEHWRQARIAEARAGGA